MEVQVRRAGLGGEESILTRKPVVCILQHRLLHYRQSLFERLRVACTERGIELRLVHGQPSAEEAKKHDTASLDWADEVLNRWYRVAGKDVLWQALPRELRRADLVVLMQENRLLSNYPWLFLPWRRSTRIAYWGHGRNLQSDKPNGWLERWKRWCVGRVDWWFAYTNLTRHLLDLDHFPPERVTVLNNAIDNTAFEAALAAVSELEIASVRSDIGSAAGAPVGLYCGSLYIDKRLELMIEAADIIFRERPDFRMVILGDGPAAEVIQSALPSRPWLYWKGAVRGHHRAIWFRAADVFMSPGAVGLHILDAFVSGLPMVTTVDAKHGPEFAYLRHGINGFAVDGDAVNFAHACLRLFADAQLMQRIRTEALCDAKKYTLDAMVRNFMIGIEQALSIEPLRRGTAFPPDRKGR